MKPAHILFNRLNVVSLRFVHTGQYETELFHCVFRRDGASLEEKNIKYDEELLCKHPALLFVSGYGVITKELGEGGEVAESVMSMPDKFFWSHWADSSRISFVRQEQVLAATGNIAGLDTNLIRTVCFSPGELETEGGMEDTVIRVFHDTVSLHRTLKADRAGAVLSMHLFRKLKFPILGIVLALLVINFIADRKLNMRYSSAQTELSALRRNAGKEENDSRQAKQTIAEFNRSLPYSYSQLADRIGAAVPAGIVLTQIAMQPLLKALENGKSPQLADREIIIRGEAGGPGDISAFIEDLRISGFAASVNLSSVEKNKEGDKSIFHINLKL